MNYLLAVILLVGVQAHAERFELSAECRTRLESQALQLELTFLESRGEALASQLSAVSHVNHFPRSGVATVVVMLEDEVDGRYVRYSQETSKENVRACRVQLTRRDHSSCRYSRGNGPESLNEIAGVHFSEGGVIRAGARLNALQKSQIRLFLDPKNYSPEASTDELIKQTEDQYLSTGAVVISSGLRLTYYGAYGGGNPFGTFFSEGTVQVAGTSSDGSVCIR